jgi:hypothetical protein
METSGVSEKVRKKGCRSGRSRRPCSVVTVRSREVADDRVMEDVGVEVDHVEIVEAAADLLQHQHV